MSLKVKSIQMSVVLRVSLNVTIHLYIKKYNVTFYKICGSELCLTIIYQAHLNFLKVSLKVTVWKTLAELFS